MNKTTPWNIQDHLKTDQDRVNFLEAALEENDKEFAAIALCDIAESLGLKMYAVTESDILIDVCPKCGKRKPLYPHAWMEDGKFCDAYWCKTCINKDNKEKAK